MWDNTADIISSALAIAVFVCVFVFPFLLAFILIKYYRRLNEEGIKGRFGTIYLEIQTSSQMSLMYNVFYLLRRLVFALLIQMGSNYPFMQVQVLVYNSVALIIYNTLYKPFEDPMMNKLEIFNEISILVATYHLILFTEYCSSPIIQYKAGWSMIVITTLNILTNMAIMCYVSYKQLRLSYLKYKQKYYRWKLSRKTKKYIQPEQDDIIIDTEVVNKTRAGSAERLVMNDLTVLENNSDQECFTQINMGQISPGGDEKQLKEINPSALNEHSNDIESKKPMKKKKTKKKRAPKTPENDQPQAEAEPPIEYLYPQNPLYELNQIDNRHTMKDYRDYYAPADPEKPKKQEFTFRQNSAIELKSDVSALQLDSVYKQKNMNIQMIHNERGGLQRRQDGKALTPEQIELLRQYEELKKKF